MATKNEIIEKHWPRPRECNVPNIPAMKDAIGKMMDEWAANQSILFIEYHRRFRIEEGVSFKRECERIGGIFLISDVGVKKIYDRFFNGDPIKSESMPGVQYDPPLMTATLNGNPI